MNFPDRIVEREFPLLGEHQYRGNGELLTDRPDAVAHFRRSSHFRLEARLAIGFRVNDLTVLHDSDRSAWDTGGGEGLAGDGVDFRSIGDGKRLREANCAYDEYKKQA